MASSKDIIGAVGKEYGDKVCRSGSSQYEDVPRLQTGIFPLDLSTGGGIPVGKVSLIFGPESSGKTNIALRSIANGQIAYPGKVAVFVDTEGAYDAKWARVMGVDTDRLVIVSPEYAEQAADIVESFLYASDVFAVVLDSIAALISQNEVESSTEKASVGGSSLLVGKLIRKVTVSFNKMRNQGFLPPAFIGINQIRHKVGVMYGNPETCPGGQAPMFASSLTLRTYGKNIVDKKIHPIMPAYKDTSVVVKKWKVPILAPTCEYKMQMVPGGGRKVGTVAEWSALETYMKKLDYLEKTKKGWSMMGNEYKLLTDCKEALYADPLVLQEMKATIIRECLMRESGGGETD